MNKVLLTGRLTRDVESRTTPSGNTVFNFGLAVSEGKDRVTFVEIEAWDNVAAGISPYLTKGKGIEVDGRIKVDEWEDKNDGTKRKSTKVVANQLTFAPGSPKKDDGEDSEVKPETKAKSAGKVVSGKKAGKVVTPVVVEAETENEDDDIPF